MVETDEYLDEGSEDENTVDPVVDSITKELMRLENVSKEPKDQSTLVIGMKMERLATQSIRTEG